MRQFSRLCVVLLCTGGLSAACSRQLPLNVLAGASMGPTLTALAPMFDSEMQVELGPSRSLCQQVEGLQRRADIVFAADGDLLDMLLIPEHADFNLIFATNRLVLAYDAQGPLADTLKTVPWQIALAEGDWRVGMADPHATPLGQRAFEALKTNDATAPQHLRRGAAIRAKLHPAHQRPDVAHLMAPLEAGEFDAAFVYHSEALQHGMASIQLDAIMPYGVTIPRRAIFPERAAALVRLLLSDEGRRVAAAAHLEVLPPALIEVRGEAPAAVWP